MRLLVPVLILLLVASLALLLQPPTVTVCAVYSQGFDDALCAEAEAAFAGTDRAAIDEVVARVSRLEPAPLDWLLRCLTSTNRGVREWSAHALGEIAPRDARVVDALIVAFDDDDDYVRWKAVRALGRIGPFAKKALPLLEPAAAAEQEVEVVRAAAQVAVQAIRAE